MGARLGWPPAPLPVWAPKLPGSSVHASLSLQQTLMKPYYLPGQWVLAAEDTRVGQNL